MPWPAGRLGSTDRGVLTVLGAAGPPSRGCRAPSLRKCWRRVPDFPQPRGPRSLRGPRLVTRPSRRCLSSSRGLFPVRLCVLTSLSRQGTSLDQHPPPDADSPPRALGCCSRSRRPPGLSGALTSGRRLGLSPCVTWCWPTSAERAVGPDQLRWPVLPASWTGHGHARLPHHRQGTRHSRRRQITRDSRRSAGGAVLATAAPSGSAGVDAAAVEGDGPARPGLLAEGQTEPWGTDGGSPGGQLS